MYYQKYGLYLSKITDLEKTILSCLLNDSNLMKNEKLTDDLFQENQKTWQFMKAFYKKYGCFDLALMYNIVSNKYNYMGFVIELLDIECVPSSINYYINQLIATRQEEEKETARINTIFGMANDLIARNINTKQFKEKIDDMFKEVKNEKT